MLSVFAVLTSLYAADADSQIVSTEAADPIAEVLVLSRRPDALTTLPASATVVQPARQEPLSAHPNELLDSVAGSWVSRGSGQEHLTAIRSPVLTGAGACGAFLLLDDGVPVRPAGFCNVNNLFELDLAAAAAVEVVRGPGSALQGSNALHGLINAVAAEPSPSRSLRLTLAENDYADLDLGVGSEQWLAQASLRHAGSFRRNESIGEQKLRIRHDGQLGDWQFDSWLAATNLNQETAGFVFGEDAYLDAQLRRSNQNPEAFRDAWSARAATRVSWSSGNVDYQLTPFVRRSGMAFLQHFLPGQPLERNGQQSVGLQWTMAGQGERLSWQWGIDLDYADGWLSQRQARPTEGSPFLVATRPAGSHYDYDVKALMSALGGQLSVDLTERWILDLGLRAEQLRYRYDNQLADGNLRDDGTECGFGGCLYNRPADRNDRFTEWAPKLALSRRTANGALFLRLTRGFRMPQATELYRLQRGQNVADLSPEKLDAFELGWRVAGTRLSFDLTAFAQAKDNFIFRDANGFNVSDGKTTHRGVEASVNATLAEQWTIEGNLSLARHRYDFDRQIGRSERIVDGNEVDTAPETLGRLALSWQPAAAFRFQLEWLHQGDYYLDAGNTAEYPGHDLLNLDWRWQVSERWQLDLGLNNLTDERYAERADFAFGNFRYFPGDNRNLRVGVSWRG